MEQKYLHCLDDGTAYVSDKDAKGAPDEVAVLPYEEGMAVIVRAELPTGEQKCVTVKLSSMEDGAAKAIADLKAAGEDSKVVSCKIKKGLSRMAGGETHDSVPHDGGRERTAVASDDDGTPSELWASGIKNAPSALPGGNIPFLTMQGIWYDAIERGDKRTEFRKQSDKYRKWFVEQHPVAVKLQRGYTNRQMVWEVVGAEDCGADGIAIHLGKRIS